jgi:hypothetical protein
MVDLSSYGQTETETLGGSMLGVQVQIVRLIDDDFPGFIECQFIDADGRLWSFIEKVPVVTELDLDGDSTYPQTGVIACEEVGRFLDSSGREIVRIETDRPWGVESIDGNTRFEVTAESLVEC